MFDSLIQRQHGHAPALALLATLPLMPLVSASAQVPAERLRIPATGPPLAAGLLFGPAVPGLI